MTNQYHKVNEIFHSLQGEGYHAGRSTVFIRMSGCNMDCNYCDTDHSEVNIISTLEVLDEVLKYDCDYVVITGGEPTLQHIEPLIESLQKYGFDVGVETNGARYIDNDRLWITVSPKGKISDLRQATGNELKFMYDGRPDSEINKFLQLRFDNYYIQPISENYDGVVDFIKRNPKWRLSLQTHKILNIL